VPGPLVLVVASCVVVVLAGAGAWWSRRQTLDRRVGSFRCNLRRGSRWPSGVAQYGAADLYWWRFWSLAPRPARRWDRSGLAIVGREPAAPGSDVLLVTCRGVSGGAEVEFVLSMSREAYAGLLSWIEATPQRVGSVI